MVDANVADRFPKLAAFVEKWNGSQGSERAASQHFLLELCEALGVAGPPAVRDTAESRAYRFERHIQKVGEDGSVGSGFADLFKEGHLLLESKQGYEAGAAKRGTAPRHSPLWTVAMERAFGQVLGYARSLATKTPFLIVCDVGLCFDVYASFDEGEYAPFGVERAADRLAGRPSRVGGGFQKHRVALEELPAYAEVFRTIFEDPRSLDPRRHQEAVTKEVADRLAALSKRLEGEGHPREQVAQFLMRCIFTMFAEDVELIPRGIFTRYLEDFWLKAPKAFPGGVQAFWRTMNEGGDLVTGDALRRFNGGLFHNPSALPLSAEALHDLLDAAKCDWSEVEPSIFGTLVERALDPKERHKLGAHFTPRAYVERLVRPTVEDPLRKEWTEIRAAVVRLMEAAEAQKTEKNKKAKKKEAVDLVRGFHRKLSELVILDPACGTGNFLYVTLDLMKRLEAEVLALLQSIGDTQTLLEMEGVRVRPNQFRGIELNPRAKPIAELVLWLGYLQWQIRTYGRAGVVDDPVLRDFQNIECRDAVLAYDGEPEIVRDASGKPVLSGAGEAAVPKLTYRNARKAAWPKADFIIGNPPFLGKLRILSSFGEGYADALRSAFAKEVPDSADFVFYWWKIAADKVRLGEARAFGFVTTNSITQIFNRRVVATATEDAKAPLRLLFAIPDHPWVDTEDGAAVRIAMTVGVAGSGVGTLATVIEEAASTDGSDARSVVLGSAEGEVRSDLSLGPNVPGATPLRANRGLTSAGVMLGARHFVLNPDSELASLANVRPLLNGSDLLRTPRQVSAIDLCHLTESEARSASPELFNYLYEIARADRAKKVTSTADSREYAKRWWQFAKPRPEYRSFTRDLRRIIITPETSKHRVFAFLPATVLPEHPMLAIGLSDPTSLGVLSSRIHLVWALAAGGTLEDRPRYNKSVCFDPFPFPDAPQALRAKIGAVAEELDAFRKARLAAHPKLTITGMYNVLEALRAGRPLSEKEEAIHAQALTATLKSYHDELDALVFEAYGWPVTLTDEEILERLVALNAERAAEEATGHVRWLRPDFQNASAKAPAQAALLEETDDEDAAEGDPEAEGSTGAAKPTGPTWPKGLRDQIVAVRDLVSDGASWGAASVAKAFSGAKETQAAEILESLAAIGVLLEEWNGDQGTYRAAKTARG